MAINARKIGAVLAALFMIGLIAVTIYARGYAERQKPLVQIALPESGTLNWSYETRSTMRPASEEERERGGGTQWVTEVMIPYGAYSDYMGELTGTSATLTTDGGILPGTARNLFRTNMDNGDVLMVLGLETSQSWDGEGVTVTIAHIGITEFQNLVPLKAIHEDAFTGQLYIFIVNKEDGAWGAEYTVHKMGVTLGLPSMIGNLMNLGVPIPENTPFVVAAEAELYHGASVRIFD